MPARSSVADLARLAAFRVFGWLPAAFASGLGGAIVRWSVPRHRPHVIAGARTNLRRLMPGASETQIEATIDSFLDSVGRVMAEYALLPRLYRENRVVPGEGVRGFLADLRGPAVVLALHTGNWEVFATLPRGGTRLAALAVVPEDPLDRRIVAEVRGKLGCTLFPATPVGLRAALRWVEDGEGPRMLVIHGDEARAGELMAPLFGREPHVSGNLALVARLVRRTGATLFLHHVTRLAGCRFVADGAVVDGLAPGMTLAEDVAHLNALIEPIIRARLGQWYFLDNRF